MEKKDKLKKELNRLQVAVEKALYKISDAQVKLDTALDAADDASAELLSFTDALIDETYGVPNGGK